MACFHPLKAFKSSGGVRVLSGDAQIWNLMLPCGQCVGCRLERSRQWALRCIHEAQLHDANCFITLTYDDEHVPLDGGLHHRDFQLFMKSLRKDFGSIRYYMCGEYGSDNDRPHFHALLFGFEFTDLVYWKKSPSGSMIFRSATLERYWRKGFSSVGHVTYESAAYVARYIMKKATGVMERRKYDSVDTVTGEVFMRRPEYNGMSLKPGIGAEWFAKYSSDVFPRDAVIHDGTPNRVPRYYDKLLSRVDSTLYDDIKSKRVLDNANSYMDNTIQRLNSKELVVNATLSKLKRGLK